jgi:hypothetical protein
LKTNNGLGIEWVPVYGDGSRPPLCNAGESLPLVPDVSPQNQRA